MVAAGPVGRGGAAAGAGGWAGGPRAGITLHGADISARDNLAMAQAGEKIGPLFEALHRDGLIDAREYLRVVYRFVGEEADLDALLVKPGKSMGETKE